MNHSFIKPIAAVTLSFSLAACDPPPRQAPEISPQDVFFERLTLMCGKAYSGKLVSNDEVDADMADKPMVMHVTRCEQHKVEIPFHVGESDNKWNRSRTWVITRNDNGLRLKHRHRHEDGALDKVTNYGGDTADDGNEKRQEFPVDDESITLFKAEGLDQSVINVWALEISEPGKRDAKFAYELRRPEGPDVRNFRVEFDLANQVEPPPPAWGD